MDQFLDQIQSYGPILAVIGTVAAVVGLIAAGARRLWTWWHGRTRLDAFGELVYGGIEWSSHHRLTDPKLRITVTNHGNRTVGISEIGCTLVLDEDVKRQWSRLPFSVRRNFEGKLPWGAVIRYENHRYDTPIARLGWKQLRNGLTTWFSLLGRPNVQMAQLFTVVRSIEPGASEPFEMPWEDAIGLHRDWTDGLGGPGGFGPNVSGLYVKTSRKIWTFTSKKLPERFLRPGPQDPDPRGIRLPAPPPADST